MKTAHPSAQQLLATIERLKQEYRHVSIGPGYKVTACCHREPLRNDFDTKFGGCQIGRREQ